MWSAQQPGVGKIPLRLIQLPIVDYPSVWQAMREQVQRNEPVSHDQWWLLEHSPVFTLGLNGDPSHLLAPGTIPVIHSDRGGQVTYHAPGQLVMYFLMNLGRLKIGVKQLVCDLEQGVIELLSSYRINGFRRPGAPGVYTRHGKIAALGLRVRKGWSYHGLSLNLDLDLSPFRQINPCGQPGLAVTSLRSVTGTPLDMGAVRGQLVDQYLGYWGHEIVSRGRTLPVHH